MERLLAVEGLTVAFPGRPAAVRVVRDVSFTVGRGEMVGLVGESGCGKTLTALALLGLVPEPGRVVAGRARLGGDDLLALSEAERRRFRGGRVAMVFQEPMTALDPVYTIGFQIAEAVRAHRPVGARPARREAERLLAQVAVDDPVRCLDAYPHQLSGGQRQRALIAMALAGGPELLLADEPTSALDVTVQGQVLELLARLRAELGLAVLLISHDLAAVERSCERVVVMYAGEVVEEAPAEELFAAPAHPYTQALLAALPRLGRARSGEPLPTLPGRVPDPAALPAGCPFHPRCPAVLEVCRRLPPELFPVAGAAGRRRARCFLHGDPPSAAGAV